MKHKFLPWLLTASLLLVLFSGCSMQPESNPDPEDEIFNQGADGFAATGADSTVFLENAFVSTAENNISTFSADVDTASYAYFRKLVNSGMNLQSLKSMSANFRTEEWINYFHYDVNAPAENELFGAYTEVVPCPWNADNRLLRITLQAETAVQNKQNNLVFLIDVSGSMSSADKLPLLKKSFAYLVGNLSPNDTVSIVTYSGKEEVILDGCSGADSATILNAVNGLTAGGSTYGEAGLTEAYRIAEKHFLQDGNNRIIMASDGDLNVGITSNEELKQYIEEKRTQGVYLSVLGFGTGNYRDSKMETLADNGNGVYYYIDGESEAEKVFGTDLFSTLYTVAQDVKLQVTFDARYISSYRLIGYENRLLDADDFRDDTKDAGEVGAGHQITVCYELVTTQQAETATDAWAVLAVNYKKPGEIASGNGNQYQIGTAQIQETAGADMQFLSCVIRTAMLLHESPYLDDTVLSDIVSDLKALDLSAYPDRMEFCTLLEKLLQAE